MCIRESNNRSDRRRYAPGGLDLLVPWRYQRPTGNRIRGYPSVYGRQTVISNRKILLAARMTITPEKKIYFLSDFHLGAPDHASSLERERKIVQFLDEIKDQAAEIFFVGDMFDFWYEYRTVVPKGFVRLLGKIGELSDAGIPMHFFVGNHDMWMKNYFQQEFNMPVYYAPVEFERNGKKFLIGHGDGLGPGDLSLIHI